VNNEWRAPFGLTWHPKTLQKTFKAFHHCELDIRDRQRVLDAVAKIKPDAIVHTAARGSQFGSSNHSVTPRAIFSSSSFFQSIRLHHPFFVWHPQFFDLG
jgi:hypothetical protein